MPTTRIQVRKNGSLVVRGCKKLVRASDGTEYDIREVIHNSAKKEAYIIVRYNWYVLPSLRVHTSVYRQHWKYKDTSWVLVGQKELKKKKKKRKKKRFFFKN